MNNSNPIFDKPIATPEEDLLGRTGFAQKIAKRISDWKDTESLALAVYGEWGEGKTSVLNLVRRELEPKQDIILADFNPWRFSDENQLISHFFRTITDAGKASLAEGDKRERFEEICSRYGLLLTSLPVEVAVPDSSLSIILLGKALTFLALLKSHFGKKKGTSTNVEILRSEIDSLLKHSEKHIVVFLDDIDRLDNEETFMFFRLIKKIADFPNVIYVMGFDPSITSKVLAERFPTDPQTGQSFLDKVVQIGSHVPPASDQGLLNLTFRGLDAVLDQLGASFSNREEQDEFVINFQTGFGKRLRTPRLAKRFSHAILLDLPDLPGEIRLSDFLLIEGIKIFYPNLYAHIRSNPNTYLDHNDRTSRSDEKPRRWDSVQTALAGLSSEEQEEAKRLLKHLFPQLDMGYGSDWQKHWSEIRRVCSKDYFQHYFHLGVPLGDVSNKKLDDLIKGISTEELNKEAYKEISNMITQSSQKFIEKLREREEKLEPEVGKRLIDLILPLSDQVPSQRGPFSDFTSPLTQLAVFVVKLLSKMSDHEKLEWGQKSVDKPTPLKFSSEIFRWIRGLSKEDKLFTDELINAIGKRLATRIKDEDRGGSIFKTHPEIAPSLTYYWKTWGDKDDFLETYKKRFPESPELITDFLLTFLPTAWGMESGIPRKSDFERSQYNQVAEFIEPDFLFDKLIKQKPDLEKFNPESFPMRLNGDTRESTVKQFVWLHRFVQNSSATQKAEKPT